jgi:hypothetical protein
MTINVDDKIAIPENQFDIYTEIDIFSISDAQVIEIGRRVGELLINEAQFVDLSQIDAGGRWIFIKYHPFQSSTLSKHPPESDIH